MPPKLGPCSLRAEERVRKGPLPLPPPVGCLFGGERERERGIEQEDGRRGKGQSWEGGTEGKKFPSFVSRGDQQRAGEGWNNLLLSLSRKEKLSPNYFFPTIIYDYNLNAHVRGKGPPPSYFYCRFPHPFLPHSLGCFLSLPSPSLHLRDKNLLVSLHFGIGGRRRVIPPGSHPPHHTAAEKHSLCSSRAREREREALLLPRLLIEQLSIFLPRATVGKVFGGT